MTMPTDRPNRPPQSIRTEKLAYWFFRLNGCLTIENFIVHPDTGRDQHTDADILGVRFPYRAELFDNPMKDHEIFQPFGDRPLLFIAEVKGSRCRLNGPWTSPDRRNMQRVLRAIGALPISEVEDAARALYETNQYDSTQYAVRLFGLADVVGEFAESYPNAIPLTWSEILRFIYHRFEQYDRQKCNHDQWDGTGRQLWSICRIARKHRDVEEFIHEVRRLLTDEAGKPVVSVDTLGNS